MSEDVAEEKRWLWMRHPLGKGQGPFMPHNYEETLRVYANTEWTILILQNGESPCLWCDKPLLKGEYACKEHRLKNIMNPDYGW